MITGDFFTLQILFSNIEDILEVHKEFLTALEFHLQPEPQSHHELGDVFLKFVSTIYYITLLGMLALFRTVQVRGACSERQQLPRVEKLFRVKCASLFSF